MSWSNVTLLVLAVEMKMQAYFYSTWKVVRREWILHLIDVGLKLINFELKTRQNKSKKRRLLLEPVSVQARLAACSVMLATLAVVGMPSILALCSASFFAILSLSSSVLSGILDLVGKEHQKSRRGCKDDSHHDGNILE